MQIGKSISFAIKILQKNTVCYTAVINARTYIHCLVSLDTLKGRVSVLSVNKLISLWMRKTHQPYRDILWKVEIMPGSFTPRRTLLVINTLDSSRTSAGGESCWTET